MKETVSIIIPSYNRERLLLRTINSVLEEASRSDIHVKIIVVDDGSTDNSFVVAKSFGSPVKAVRQQHQGPNVARNHGLTLANGDFIRFIDSDDWLVNQCVTRKQIELLNSTHADVCYGHWFDTYESLDPTEHRVLRSRGEMHDPVECLLDDMWCAPFCYLFRREAVFAVKGWTNDLSACQDFDFIIRIALNGNKFVRYDGIIGHYHHHSGSRISQGDLPRWCDCRFRVIDTTIFWLNQHNEWTQGRRRAIANSLLNLGKIYFAFDRHKFQTCLHTMQNVYPDFQPPNAIYRWFVNWLGYAKMETLLQLKRCVLKKRRLR